MGNAQAFFAAAVVFVFAGCAHEPERRAAPATARAAAAPVPATEATTFQPDADGDGLADAVDPCPLEPAAAGGCPTQFGYFFLRVIDGNTLKPVDAVLAFEPVVNRIVTADDGFSGTLAPGRYRLRAEAPGYASAELEFVVEADHKSVVELRLERKEAP